MHKFAFPRVGSIGEGGVGMGGQGKGAVGGNVNAVTPPRGSTPRPQQSYRPAPVRFRTRFAFGIGTSDKRNPAELRHKLFTHPLRRT